jgi:hypothetical protein
MLVSEKARIKLASGIRFRADGRGEEGTRIRIDSPLSLMRTESQRRVPIEGVFKMVKKVAAVTFILVLESLPARCSSIDFEGSGNGGTWSWSGIGALTATSFGLSAQALGSPNSYRVAIANESFTSGPFFGGSGTTSSPWTFASSPMSFIIRGCVPPADSCAPVTLFNGEFNTPGETDVQGSRSMIFTGTEVTGTVNPALLNFLGLPSSFTSYTGTYDVTLLGTAPGSGLVASGDLVISPTPVPSPTPEPSSLALLGIGLLVLAFVARRTVFRA